MDSEDLPPLALGAGTTAAFPFGWETTDSEL
jgi:hypothetical protein